MRHGFSNPHSLKELRTEYSQSNEYSIRSAWEAHYSQPSLGNPLFENVPVVHHIVHLMAIADGLSKEADMDSDDSDNNALHDNHMSAMISAMENGEDPFQGIRGSLKVIADQDEVFDDIDF